MRDQHVPIVYRLHPDFARPSARPPPVPQSSVNDLDLTQSMTEEKLEQARGQQAYDPMDHVDPARRKVIDRTYGALYNRGSPQVGSNREFNAPRPPSAPSTGPPARARYKSTYYGDAVGVFGCGETSPEQVAKTW